MSRNDDDGTQKLLIGGGLAIVAIVSAVFFLMGSNEAMVSGAVTLDGTPLAEAQVVFLGEDANNQSPVVAQSDESGKYALTGVTGGGIPPGKYRATVSKQTLKDGTRPIGEELEKARIEERLLNTLPKPYEDRATTPLQFEVRSGNNTINLELKKQP